MEIGAFGKPTPKILVVDDEEDTRYLLSRMLTAFGFQVMTAENGIQAWNLFLKIVYDLVITDFQMPGIDGLRLAENIKRRCPTTPVILISGSDLDQIRDSGGLRNIDHFVSKPFRGTHIRDIILRTLDDLPSVQGR